MKRYLQVAAATLLSSAMPLASAGKPSGPKPDHTCKDGNLVSARWAIPVPNSNGTGSPEVHATVSSNRRHDVLTVNIDMGVDVTLPTGTKNIARERNAKMFVFDRLKDTEQECAAGYSGPSQPLGMQQANFSISYPAAIASNEGLK